MAKRKRRRVARTRRAAWRWFRGSVARAEQTYDLVCEAMNELERPGSILGEYVDQDEIKRVVEMFGDAYAHLATLTPEVKRPVSDPFADLGGAG